MSATTKNKQATRCKYWDKCYRRNPQHLADFIHPDSEADAEFETDGDSDVGVGRVSTVGDEEDNDNDNSPGVGVGKDGEEENGGDALGDIAIDGDTAPEDVVEVNEEGEERTAAGQTPPEDHKPDDDDEEDESKDKDLDFINGVAPKKLLKDGDTVDCASKSSSAVYKIKRTGDHYYCTCPAWRNQGGVPINARSCKHLKEVLGDAYESARCGQVNASASSDGKSTDAKRKRGNAGAAAGPAAKKAKAIAPALILANSWDQVSGPDPTGWWVSEKLDGVRALWDPVRRQFVSRLGNPFTAPDWFIDAMPTNMSLDGELFCGRGKFSQTVSVVKTIDSKLWHTLKFHVFDAPSLTTKQFERRLEDIASFFRANPAVHVHLVEQEKCTGKTHLLKRLKEVEEKGGEGLMLRKSQSLYEGKRSPTLLKIKSFYDAEAEVTGYEPGNGKHKGVCGALQCVMESGKRFKVGTGLADAQRRNPPKIGDIVTYRFQELTNDGVPRFPSYIGVRVDANGPKDYVFP
ncbi:uncharacterized protein EV422DRAFT_558398, partial [Fimicolochytrium jonesii]|uniref:uncharacterized protein n=1 Tax=Fimicolochytrium jonesii TaxID=1396493 RepID=UPI0022FE4C52